MKNICFEVWIRLSGQESKIGKIKIFLWNTAYFLHEKHKNCPKFPKYFSNSHSDIIWVGIQRITINLMCNEVLNWSSIFQYKWQKVQNVPIIDKYFKISPIKRIWNTFSTLNFRARFLCTCDFIVKATTRIAFGLPRLPCLVNLKTERHRIDQPLKTGSIHSLFYQNSTKLDEVETWSINQGSRIIFTKLTS